MHRLSLFLALALVACAAPAPPPVTGLRDTGKPIYSNAVYDPARITGTWNQVATFTAAADPGCPPGRVTIAGSAGALTHEADLCLGGTLSTSSGPLDITGPGRVRPERAVGALDAEWWLLWVDVDYRTLVVGNPAGSFGFILDRSTSLPVDRLAAAREVLDWNGYDLGKLRLYGR